MSGTKEINVLLANIESIIVNFNAIINSDGVSLTDREKKGNVFAVDEKKINPPSRQQLDNIRNSVESYLTSASLFLPRVENINVDNVANGYISNEEWFVNLKEVYRSSYGLLPGPNFSEIEIANKVLEARASNNQENFKKYYSYLYSTALLRALNDTEQLERDKNSIESQLKIANLEKRKETENKTSKDVDFNMQIESAKKAADELEKADAEIYRLRKNIEENSISNLASLDNAQKQLVIKNAEAEKARGDADSAKLVLSQYRQVSAVRDQYLDSVTSQMKKYNESQERYINQLRSIVVANIRRDDDDPQPHVLGEDSDVWKREAGVFTENLRNMMVNFATEMARLSEHRNIETNALYAKNDMHAKITGMLQYFHERLDAMLAYISQTPIPVYFTPEQSCIPPRPRIGGIYYCWDRYSEKEKLREIFTRAGAPSDITVVCCDGHRNAIRQVREVTVIGYTMMREFNGQKRWNLRVKNGF